jgi:hypothetical protein
LQQNKHGLNEAIAETSVMKFNFEKMESNLKKLKREKNDLEDKHVKTSEELKFLKSTHYELKKEKYKVNVTLKGLKKEVKENDYRQHKIIKSNEDAIEEFLAYKGLKTKEDKLIKHKKKKLDNKLKQVKYGEVKNDSNGKDLYSNANESTNLEESITDTKDTDTILHSVQIKNSFQQLDGLRDLEGQCTEYTTCPLLSALRLPTPSSLSPPGCVGSTPELPAARSPPASTSSTSASSSSQLGIMKPTLPYRLITVIYEFH